MRLNCELDDFRWKNAQLLQDQVTFKGVMNAMEAAKQQMLQNADNFVNIRLNSISKILNWKAVFINQNV